MAKVICYSIGCPNCKRLESRLKEKNINFDLITDKEVMIKKGFKSAPILEIDGDIKNYKEAINWIKEQ